MEKLQGYPKTFAVGHSSTLTQEKPFKARLAQVPFFAVVASLTILITQLALAGLHISVFAHGTFWYTICKLQEERRFAAGAHIRFVMAGVAP